MSKTDVNRFSRPWTFNAKSHEKFHTRFTSPASSRNAWAFLHAQRFDVGLEQAGQGSDPTEKEEMHQVSEHNNPSFSLGRNAEALLRFG